MTLLASQYNNGIPMARHTLLIMLVYNHFSLFIFGSLRYMFYFLSRFAWWFGYV